MGLGHVAASESKVSQSTLISRGSVVEPTALGDSWVLCAVASVDPARSPLKAEVLSRPNGRLPLGAIYTPQATSFSIWSPDTADAKLILEGNSSPIPMAKIPDTDEYTDVYRITVTGDQLLRRYHFQLRGNDVRDPYGVMVEPGTNNNLVMDLSATIPGRWMGDATSTGTARGRHHLRTQHTRLYI